LKKTFTIIAPDTDCGKTYATARMMRDAISKNINVMACKPIQTGSADGKSQDLDFIFKAADLSVPQKIYEKLVLRTFSTPCSPLLASAIESQSIDLDGIAEKIREVSQDYDLFFVETAGGIYSPITESATVADFARMLGFPVIICVPNRVGAISLSVLAVKAAIAEGLEIEGVIFTQTIKPQNETDELICKTNIEQFQKMTGVKIIADYEFNI